ncbi:MAG: hypothetical protein KAT04_03975 [Methylococcales bacterium]|nr:hypothetical protein [Methylococcales bacterium]
MNLSYADNLMHLVDQLEIPYLYERSFKVSQQSFLTNRFLITINKKLLQPDTWPILLSITKAMNMPQIYEESIQDKLSNANFIHLGFEQQEDSCLCKIYLEFPQQFQNALKSNCAHSEHILLHLAFKWDVFKNSKHSIATYHCQPFLTLEAMRERFATVTNLAKNGIITNLGKQLLTLANTQITERQIFFIDVAEQENARRSFDINVYDANITLENIENILLPALLKFNIPTKQWKEFLESVKHHHLGHLSGGIGRNEKEFFSVFYGVENRG